MHQIIKKNYTVYFNMQDLKFLWITILLHHSQGIYAFTLTPTLTLIFKFHANRQVCLKPAYYQELPHTKRQHMTLTFSDQGLLNKSGSIKGHYGGGCASTCDALSKWCSHPLTPLPLHPKCTLALQGDLPWLVPRKQLPEGKGELPPCFCSPL